MTISPPKVSECLTVVELFSKLRSVSTQLYFSVRCVSLFLHHLAILRGKYIFLPFFKQIMIVCMYFFKRLFNVVVCAHMICIPIHTVLLDWLLAEGGGGNGAAALGIDIEGEQPIQTYKD